MEICQAFAFVKKCYRRPFPKKRPEISRPPFSTWLRNCSAYACAEFAHDCAEVGAQEIAPN